ncbi:PEP/pyruvate-binding domain-containing protein [Nocardia sp. NPDC059239]|uniref:PEP/pyruvate-binding domain-containing protein n=1 Tax=unclassified Nocardia TaxID=2637762 RepID=UPI00367DD2F5
MNEPQSIALIGGKAVGLGKLLAHDLAVPEGFVITTEAYFACITDDVRERIAEIAQGARTHDQLTASSDEIRALFTRDRLLSGVAAEIRSAYAGLGGGQTPVAVRSSATAEDTVDASFAGQQDTYLWIRGADAVVDHVLSCWASLFSAAAIGYRSNLSVSTEDLAMAVVVQRMVPADAAGVMMTLDPATGDRSSIYVESAFGLGEGVVKGDTGSDSFWVDHSTFETTRSEVREKARAYRVVEPSDAVVLAPVPDNERYQRSISDAELRAIAELGAHIEQVLGSPQDVEWALAPGRNGVRDLYLLQTRPETVWSRTPRSSEESPSIAKVGFAPADPNDVNLLHATGDTTALWTVTNIQEAIPGVETPMTWSYFGEGGEYALRNHFHHIGALSASESRIPNDQKEWILGLFYGRCAMRVDLLATWADRVPGMSGEALVSQFFSTLTGSLTRKSSRMYSLAALLKFPTPFLSVPPLMRRNRSRVAAFWRTSLERLPTASRSGVEQLIEEAYDHFSYSLGLQVRLTMGAFATVSKMLATLASTQSEVSVHELVAGYGGHEETELVKDMWDLSREKITLDHFLSEHGYHGWQEGELSNKTWREDPSMIHEQVAAYRLRPEGENPHQAEARRAEQRVGLEAQFLRALPARRRPHGRLVLKLASIYLPMRGVSKVAFLQGLDVARSAVRRMGEYLVADNVIDDVEDVFYLTRDEVKGVPPADARALIKQRKDIRRRYQTFEVPDAWQGIPEQIDPTSRSAIELIEGTPASPGVVEGIARVVLQPADAHLAEGEILIARDTDPAWASLMFLSSALIADIGGVMSHTAVVARELGIPCVVNTKLASRTVSTGDLVRVDGAKGTIEILARAET